MCFQVFHGALSNSDVLQLFLRVVYLEASCRRVLAEYQPGPSVSIAREYGLDVLSWRLREEEVRHSHRI